MALSTYYFNYQVPVDLVLRALPIYELSFLSVSPLTFKLSNFMEGLEVEQGLSHTVDPCSSFHPTLIFIIPSKREYSIFQIMNTMHAIVSTLSPSSSQFNNSLYHLCPLPIFWILNTLSNAFSLKKFPLGGGVLVINNFKE